MHFAQSDALVRNVAGPTIWWHSTDRPTLILGTGQQWDQVDTAACRREGVLLVRRQAGGTAVYATTGVLGLDVALPAGHRLAVPDVVEAYRWLGEVWVDALRSLGVHGELVSLEAARQAARELRPYADIVGLACFGSLSPYEVVAGGRKLVGLAQVRRRAGILLQAGVHRKFDPDALARLLPGADRDGVTAALRKAAVGLDEAASRAVKESEVMDAFHRSLMETLRVDLQQGEWSAKELEHVCVLTAEGDSQVVPRSFK